MMGNPGINRRMILFAILVIVLAMAGSCKGTADKDKVRRPPVSGVTVTAVVPTTVDATVEVTGTVRSERTSVVAARAMGVVTSLLVREGDTVEAGQLLLTIDDRDAAQRVKAATMAVAAAKENKALAEVTWQRYKNLYEDKALSRQEMDQVEAQKKVAAAEYERVRSLAEEARTYRSFTRVTAPVAGRVTEKRIDAGSMASPGMPLLTIEGGGGFHVEAAVTEGLQDKVKTGMTVEVIIDTLNRRIRGTIREVIPAIDPLSRTFMVKVGLGETLLRSGLFARVCIPVGRKEAIIVPESAIVRKGQLTGVYAVDGHGIISYRLVRTGIAHASGTEILSGLTAHDRIITGGLELAVDGGVVSGGQSK